MDKEKIKLINIDEELPNNITDENGEAFEFYQNNIWKNSFLSPEIPDNQTFIEIKNELSNISELVKDIKLILQDIFELK